MPEAEFEEIIATFRVEVRRDLLSRDNAASTAAIWDLVGGRRKQSSIAERGMTRQLLIARGFDLLP